MDYIHGKVHKKEGYRFDLYHENKKFGRIGFGQEFDLTTTNKILFGRNSKDKDNLKILFQWMKNSDKGIQDLNTNSEYNIKNLEDSDITIIGLSTQADMGLIELIRTKRKTLKVYYYTDEDKDDWLNYINEEDLCSAQKLPFIVSK